MVIRTSDRHFSTERGCLGYLQRLSISVRVFGLGGAVTFLPEKFTQFPNSWLLKSGYKRTQIARKTRSQFTVCGEIVVAFQFRGYWIFQVSREKKSRIWISDLTRGNNFSRIHVQYLKVTEMEGIWSFSLRCLQPISLKFSNGGSFCWRD